MRWRLALALAVALPCAGVACGGDDAASEDAGARDGGGSAGGDAGSGGSCIAAPAGESGQATYYDANGTGACSFPETTNFLIAAINAADYGNGEWCGGCVDVSGPQGDVVVRVVDKCPGCAAGDLDLSQTAFKMISPLSAGRVPITWHETECPETGPISYELEPGSSPDYAAIQVRDTRYPVASLESIDGSGTAHALVRRDDDYFVAVSGLGSGPYSLRVTDQRGHVLDDTGLALHAGSDVAGAAQFPTCP